LAAQISPCCATECKCSQATSSLADQDGVVVVPRAKAAEILALALDMDNKEHSMYPVIEKFKSLQEAVKQFGRL